MTGIALFLIFSVLLGSLAISVIGNKGEMKLWHWAVVFLCMTLKVTFAASIVKADDASERKQFFHDVKDAIFFDGTRYNCCGEGDATRARIIASHGDMLAVEIIDTMRHPTAKKGEIVNVPRRLIVKNPLSPQKMGTILFLNTVAKNRSPYCLVQQRAGG